MGPLDFFTIEPGETTSIRIGPPFVVKADVQRRPAGRRWPSARSLSGCAGENSTRRLFSGTESVRRAATFKIVDEKGTVLVADKFGV